uniref:Uncharacterized protein n=1 Tax=Rhizophora mucronata TaxID=61149 RepID=A0A2P2N083_RHIMU
MISKMVTKWRIHALLLLLMMLVMVKVIIILGRIRQVRTNLLTRKGP